MCFGPPIRWAQSGHSRARIAVVRADLRGAVLNARVAQAMMSLSAAPLRRVQVRPLLADAWSRRANLTIADALYVSNAPTLSVATIHP